TAPSPDSLARLTPCTPKARSKGRAPSAMSDGLARDLPREDLRGVIEHRERHRELVVIAVVATLPRAIPHRAQPALRLLDVLQRIPERVGDHLHRRHRR